MRLGPGPVFVYEGILAARRWQTYAARAAVLGVILAGLTLIWRSLTRDRAPDEVVSLRVLADFGRSIYSTISMTELTLVLLIAPAATAGAVCLDRARGTLDHILTTDLSSAEVVLGKLGVRLVPVLGLIAAMTPLLFLASLLGGIEPSAIVALLLVATGCAAVGCSPAILLSVHGRKTHEVLMLAYLLLALWLIAPAALIVAATMFGSGPAPTRSGPLLEWFEKSNPYLLAYEPTRSAIEDSPGFLAGCLAASAAMAAVATLRLRRVVAAQAGRPERAGRERASWRLNIPGPSLDANPVAWREWHRSRPSRMMRAAWAIYSLVGLVGMVAIACAPSWSGPRGEAPVFATMFEVTVGLLLLSVAAATSLAEERASGSLDLLLTTTITTREILAGKWWGSFRRAGFVAFWPMAMVAIAAAWNGTWAAWIVLLGLLLAYGATITSLGLAAATRIRHPGRAVAACVAAYALFVVGWPVLVFLNLGGSAGNEYLVGLALLADPAYGAVIMTLAIVDPTTHLAPGRTAGDFLFEAFLWIAADVLVAVILNAATFVSFDHTLGRMPEGGTSPPWRPRGRSASKSAEPVPLDQ